MSAYFASPKEDDDGELSDGPGRRLRAARESRGLELAQVADQLYLSATVIESLEQEDYAALGGQVFVAGYIRKYARLVGLDPESLLAAYHKTAAQSGPVRTRIAPRASRQVRSGHLLVRLTSAGISILLAALAFLWWQGRQTDTEVERTDSSAARNTWSTTKPDTVSPPQIPDLPAETDRIVVPEADSAPEPELGTRAPQPESPSAPSATEQQQPSAVATTEDSDEASTDDNQTANPESPPLTRPRGDEEPVAREEGEAEEAPAEAREIVMRFDGPCWVDVRGSEGKYKLFGEMKKGDRHVLEGKPPYSVILGNAAAVEITIGGTAFDVSAIARGNVARFTLNPNETP